MGVSDRNKNQSCQGGGETNDMEILRVDREVKKKIRQVRPLVSREFLGFFFLGVFDVARENKCGRSAMQSDAQCMIRRLWSPRL